MPLTLTIGKGLRSAENEDRVPLPAALTSSSPVVEALSPLSSVTRRPIVWRPAGNAADTEEPVPSSKAPSSSRSQA